MEAGWIDYESVELNPVNEINWEMTYNRPSVSSSQLHNYPTWGRDHPQWLQTVEIVLRILLLHFVFIANYSHLSWTLHRPATARQRVLKLILVFFLPTFLAAELIMSVGSTLSRLLQTKKEDLKWPKVAEWKRYACAALGMYSVPDPEAEHGEDSTESQSTSPDSVPLSDIRFYDDLRLHPQPWNGRAILRVVLVLLASLFPLIAQAIQWDTMRELGDYHDIRYIICIACNGVCTLSALVVLLSRSEWSMLHLTESESPREKRPLFMFAAKLAIAAYIYELPFAERYYWGWRYTGSFVYVFWYLGSFNIVWPIAAILAYAFRKEISERFKINWWLIFAVVLVVMCLDIGLDVIGFFIEDMKSIFGW